MRIHFGCVDRGFVDHHAIQDFIDGICLALDGDVLGVYDVDISRLIGSLIQSYTAGGLLLLAWSVDLE